MNWCARDAFKLYTRIKGRTFERHQARGSVGYSVRGLRVRVRITFQPALVHYVHAFRPTLYFATKSQEDDTKIVYKNYRASNRRTRIKD